MSLLVYLQASGNTIHDVSLELCTKARELAQKTNSSVSGILVGRADEKLKAEIQKTGLSVVYEYVCPEPLVLDDITTAVMHCIRLINPDIVLFGATLEGRSIAPTVAAYCQTGVTADCTELAIDSDGLLVQIRPAFGGNIMAEILTPKARPQIATVRPGVFTADRVELSETYIQSIELDGTAKRVRIEEIHIHPIQERNLSNSIIAVGAGLQNKEELEVLSSFCEKHGIPLMCSRALVERTWLPQSRQIGLSGTSVSSRLLITIGISGSVQFISGIKHVERLVAINTDKTASIMKRADLPICADLHELLLHL